MAYTTVEDVLAAAPQIELSPTSRPVEGDVATWIVEIENVLNGALASVGYLLPITDPPSPLSVAILRDMVVHAVIARILAARLYGVGDLAGSGAAEAQKYFDDRLKWLMDPKHPFELPDVAVGGSVSPRVWSFGNFESTGDDDPFARATMTKVF